VSWERYYTRYTKLSHIMSLRIGRIAIIGAALIAGFLFFRESFSKGLGTTLQSIGSGGASVGSGVESVLGGIGRGSAQLLNPFFSIIDLAATL